VLLGSRGTGSRAAPSSRRLAGSNVEAFSLHPGVIQTPLGRHVGTQAGTWTGWLFGWLGAYWIKSTQQARRPAAVHAAQRCAGVTVPATRDLPSFAGACMRGAARSECSHPTDIRMLNARLNATPGRPHPQDAGREA